MQLIWTSSLMHVMGQAEQASSTQHIGAVHMGGRVDDHAARQAHVSIGAMAIASYPCRTCGKLSISFLCTWHRWHLFHPSTHAIQSSDRQAKPSDGLQSFNTG